MSDTAEQIGAAYRWILGRDPDPTGLATYQRELANGSLAAADMREALLASPEFQQSREDLREVDIGNGVRVVVDAKEPEFGRAIVERGAWEPHILDAIDSILRPGDTFVDVGANVGVMAFRAARAVGASGRVIAFEPHLSNAAMFQRGMLANRFTQVRLHIVAAADRFDLISITRASNAKTGGTRGALSFDYIVQADRLDNYLERERRVDLIKIDIEGFELPALEGLSETIARHKPRILCEYNPLCFQALGYKPADVARYYFDLASKVEVIDHGPHRMTVASPSELLSLWDSKNEENSRNGTLPEGWFHFDLVVETR